MNLTNRLKNLIALLLAISFSPTWLFSGEFNVKGKVIHPIIIDCLYSNILCKEKVETVYFEEEGLDDLSYNVLVSGGSYPLTEQIMHRYNFETQNFFYYDHFSKESYFDEEKKELPNESLEFHPGVAGETDRARSFIEYSVIFELENFPYDIKKKEYLPENFEEGDFSHWLINFRAWKGKESPTEVSNSWDAFMVLELFKSAEEGGKNYLRLIKVMPNGGPISMKYGANFKYYPNQRQR